MTGPTRLEVLVVAAVCVVLFGLSWAVTTLVSS